MNCSWIGYDSKGYCLTDYINGVYQPALFVFNPVTNKCDEKSGPLNTEGTGELQFGSNNYIYAIYKNWISGDTYNYYLWNYDLNEAVP